MTCKVITHVIILSITVKGLPGFGTVNTEFNSIIYKPTNKYIIKQFERQIVNYIITEDLPITIILSRRSTWCFNGADFPWPTHDDPLNEILKTKKAGRTVITAGVNMPLFVKLSRSVG